MKHTPKKNQLVLVLKNWSKIFLGTAKLARFAFQIKSDLRSVGSTFHALMSNRLSADQAIKVARWRGPVLYALARGRASVATILLLVLVTLGSIPQSQPVQAINEQLNFQARVLNDSGALIPDGNWNIRFKIYCGGDGDTTGAGTGTDCNDVENEQLLWTETYDYNGGAPDRRVVVKNGYISVKLGELNNTLGSAIDWTQDELYLSIEIGGDQTAAAWDGEMDPFMRFTSVPYAFSANNLDGLDSSEFVQLGQGATQTVNSAGTSISVNQTGAGDIIDLQAGGTSYLNINNAGNTTLGGNLTVEAGTVNVGEASTTTGNITFYDSNSANYIRLQAGDMTASGGNLVFTLPTSDGNTNECLATNGAGELSFVACTAAITLQAAYSNGNNITTTDNRDIEFDLAENAGTPANESSFIVNIQGTNNTFQVQDNGVSVLRVVDGGDVIVGADNIAGTLLLSDGEASALYATLSVEAPLSQATTYLLPITTSASVEICTTDGNCAGASGNNLQQAYDASAGGSTPEIKLDSTRGGVDIQDADSSIAGSLLTVRASNGSGLGAALFDIDSSGYISIQNTTDATDAFQIFDADGGNPVLSVDTDNERVGIGTATPSQKLTLFNGSFLITADSASLTDGSSLNSGDIIMQGYYDSDGTGGVTATARTMSLRTIVDASGDEKIGVFNNAATEFITFDGANARLGVNVTAPTVAFDVLGNSLFTGDVSITADLTVDTTTLVVDASSNSVGIGTASPDAALEVAGNRSQTAWGTNGVQLQVSGAALTDNTSPTGTVALVTASSFGQSTIDATNTVTFTDAATVYIQGAPVAGGDETITNSYALFVDGGAVRFDDDLTVGGNLDIGLTQGSIVFAGANGLTQDNANLFFNSATALLGIGTDSPSERLTIADGNALLVADETTLVDGGSLNSGDVIFQGYYDSDGTAGITATARAVSLRTIVDTSGNERLGVFNNGSTEFITFDGANGRLGVNVTAPTVALDVLGNALITGDITITADLVVDTDTLVVDSSSGSVGIGTATPSAALQIAGNRTQTAWGANGIQLQVASATLTDSDSATGTVGLVVANSFGQPTIDATNTVTYTDAATLYIQGAPVADGGGDDTITNAYSLFVDDGNVRFDGDLAVNGGNITSTAGLSLDVADTNSFTVTDGTNTLFSVADGGTVGNATVSGTLAVQGASATLGASSTTDGSLVFLNSTNAFSVTINAPDQTVGSAVFSFPDTAGVGDEICLATLANCAGTGGGVTTPGGTTNRIAVFTGSQTLGDSSIIDDGTDVTFDNVNVTLDTDSSALTDGSSLNSRDIILQGYYDSDGTAGVTATARQMNLRVVVDASGNERLAILNNSGTEFVSFNGATSRVGIGLTDASTTLQVDGILTVGDAGNTDGSIRFERSGDAFRGTLQFAALDENTVITIPDPGSGVTTDTVCLFTLNNCAGSGNNLQQAYDASTGGATAEIVVDTTRGAVTIRDNGSAIGANLFEVQTNGSADVFSVAVDQINLAVNTVVSAGNTLRLVGDDTASRPVSPDPGELYYDTDTDTLLTYNGTKWVADRGEYIIVASGHGTNPSTQAERDSADYVTDGTADQTEINNALTAAAGGKVLLLGGTYVIDGSISIPNNTTLAGVGPGTNIEVDNIDVDIDAIINTDTTTGTGVVIRDLTLNGRDDLNLAGVQRGIYFNNMGDNSGASATVGGRVENVTVRDFRTYGMLISSSNNNSVTNSTFLANNTAIFTNSSSVNNTFSSNLIQGNSGSGIYLAGGSDTTISGNTIEGNAYGVRLDSASSNTVTGNTISTSSAVGVFLDNGSNNNTVSSNTLTNSGDTGENDAITIDASDNNLIIGNNITDSSCTTDCYAIYIVNSTSDNNYLADNNLGSNGTINDAGTGTVYANQSQTANGGQLLVRTADDANAFQVQNAAGSAILNVDTTYDRLGVNTDSPNVTLDVNGSGRFIGTGTETLTGSIDPDGTTTVTGVNTLFLSELVVGDRITVSGETRTVVAIASDTSLTVDIAFSDNADDTSPDRLPAILTVFDSGSTPRLIINDQGNVGIGVLTPSSLLQIDGALTVGDGGNTNGSLVFERAANGNSITFVLEDQTIGSATITIPDLAGVSDTLCLETLGNCSGASINLQQAYTNSTGGTTPEIKLDSTRGGLDIQDADTTIAGNLLTVRAANGSGLGTSLLAVSSTGATSLNALQPASETGNGTNAPVVLTVTGATGGDTSGTTGQLAGSGSAISLTAGDGGDAPSGSTNGDGGSITLQAGSAGAGAGTAGSAGNVLINPNGTGNVGIGTGSPEFRLNVVTNGNSFISNDTYGGASVFQSRRANGSVGSPSALSADDLIAQFSARGYGTTGFSGTRASIGLYANQIWTDANQGTRMSFFVTPDNTTSLLTALTIANNGQLTSTGVSGQDQRFSVVSGASTEYSIIQLRNGVGNDEWHLQSTPDGAAFEIVESGVEARLSIAETTGDATFSSNVNVQGGSLTVGESGTTSGNLVFARAANSNTITLTAANQTTGSATITIPDVGGASDTVCLLTLNNCAGSGNNLQQAYDAGNTITTTTARNIQFVLADTATDSIFDISVADNSAGYVSISRADGTGTTNPAQLLLVDNLDANQLIGAGIRVQSAAGAITTGLDVSDAEITNAISVGDNVILGGSATIDFDSFDVTAGGAGTFASTLAVQGSGITVGTSLTTNGSLTLLNATNSFQVTIQAIAQDTGSATLSIPNTAGVNDEFCLVALGNCGGSGGGVTTSGGTTNVISKFTGAQTLGDSTLTDNGTALTLNNTNTARFVLNADSANGANENANPEILFQQDGGVERLRVGLNGDANNQFSGALQDGAYLYTSTGSDLQVASSSTGLLMTILDTGNVGIGNLNNPAYKLQVVGPIASGDANTRGQIVLFDNDAGSETVTLQAGSFSSSLTFTLPTTTGTTGDCIKTDGSGILSFGACGTGVGSSYTQGSVIFANSSNSLTEDNDNFYFNNSNDFLGIGLGSAVAARLHVSDSITANAWGLNGIVLRVDAATYTDDNTAASGTATNAAINAFGQPTLAATNSTVTTTNAATLYVAGAPVAGTNQTITNAYALWLDSGQLRVDDANPFQIRPDGDGGNVLTISAPTGISSDYTYSLPDASGTFCLTSGNCSGVGGNGDVLLGGNTISGDVILGNNSTAGANDRLVLETANTGRIYINEDGSINFQHDAASTSIFQIFDTNSTDITLLQVDSTNDRIYVGDTTADATGTLLVVDTKNTTGDPTGVNGAIYYNSATGKFRCYEDGAWKNCSDPDTVNIAFAPEYPNAVVSLVSGTISTTTGNVTGLSAGEGYEHNYYNMNNGNAALGSTDIAIRYRIPDNFNAFNNNSFQVWRLGTDTSTANNNITYTMRDADGTVCVNAQGILPSTANVWEEITLNNPSGACTFTAGDTITFVFRVSAKNSTNPRLGEFEFSYDT